MCVFLNSLFLLCRADIPWCDGSRFAWPFTYCGASVLLQALAVKLLPTAVYMFLWELKFFVSLE